MKTLFRNATIVNATATQQADLLIEGEKITAIAPNLPSDSAEVVDCTGLLLMPGGIDPHVHLALPMFGTISSDDHYSGHKAAAFGGTTTAIDFTAQAAGGSLQASIDEWHAKAQGKAAIDYSFHVNVTDFNQSVAQEIGGLAQQGLTTLKMFTAYNGRLRLGDGEIFQVMQLAEKYNLLCMLHCEQGDVIDYLIANALASGRTQPVWHARTRPAWGEADASLRAVALAASTGARAYIVHMTCGLAVDQLQYGRSRGAWVMGETCPQYLFFSEKHLERPDGAKWVCSPPMRTEQDNVALWQALSAGTLQTVGTDHCPFYYNGSQPILYEGKPVAIAGKELGVNNFTEIPNGLPAIEHRLTLLWSYGVKAGWLTPEQFVSLTSTHAARIFGMYPQKGVLAVGSDADLVVWHPDQARTISAQTSHMRTDHDLWEATPLQGGPVQVWLRGRKIVDGTQWLGAAGAGRFLRRGAGEWL
jgi:dihydropyrimidinase